MARYDISQIKSLAIGLWPELLGLDNEILDRLHHPCPKCGGRDRFRALDDFRTSGAVICNKCFNVGNGDGIAAYAWLHDCTNGQAIEAIAKELGVEPSKKQPGGGRSQVGSKKRAGTKSVKNRHDSEHDEPRKGKSLDQLFAFKPWNESLAAIFCTRKRGISVPSLVAVGARFAIHSGVTVIALPIRDGNQVVGYTAANCTGGKIAIQSQDKTQPPELTTWKNKIPSKAKGVIATESLFTGADQIKRVFKTEGPSDLLAIIPFLAADEAAFCNPCGANENPEPFTWLAELLTGKQIIVIHDRDAAGVSGAIGDEKRSRLGWASWAASFTSEARNVELPYPLVDSHGKDLRDWVCDGGDRAGLDKLIEEAAIIEAADAIKAISNYTLKTYFAEDGSERRVKHAIHINDIVEQVRGMFGGWPKCVDGQLFYQSGDSTRYFTSASSLFGWMRESRQVKWGQGEDLPTKEEFFSVILEKAEKYLELQSYPHFPPIKNMFYTCSLQVPHGNMEALNGFLDFFTPDKPLDRQLMMACIATVFWGGPSGQRPGWLITSPLRQGAGKSSFSEKVAALVGGLFDFNTKADPDKDKTRLLSSEGASKRCARYDNIKAVRFSLSTLEALITSSSISGHRMYRGEGSRANYLTWFITMNDPELSRDLAQRCVSISLGAPKRDGDWTGSVNVYIEKNRSAIISDVAAFFNRPINMVRKVNRWGSWVKDVLCRLDNPQEVFDLIEEREAKNDSDTIGAEDLNEYIHDKMKKLGYDHPSVVHIPNNIMAKWVNNCIGNNMRAAACLKMARQFYDSGLLHEVEPNPSRTSGRGWIYRSLGIADCNAVYDLEKRIFERNKKFQNENFSPEASEKFENKFFDDDETGLF